MRAGRRPGRAVDRRPRRRARLSQRSRTNRSTFRRRSGRSERRAVLPYRRLRPARSRRRTDLSRPARPAGEDQGLPRRAWRDRGAAGRASVGARGRGRRARQRSHRRTHRRLRRAGAGRQRGSASARRAPEGCVAGLHGSGECRDCRGAAAAAERQDRSRAAGVGRGERARQARRSRGAAQRGRGKAARRSQGRARLRRRGRRGQLLRSRRHLVAGHALPCARQRRSERRTRSRRPDAGRDGRFAGGVHRGEDQCGGGDRGTCRWRAGGRHQFLLAAAAAGPRRKRAGTGERRCDRLPAGRDRVLAAVQGPARRPQGRRTTVLDRRRQPVVGNDCAGGGAKRRPRVLRRSGEGAQQHRPGRRLCRTSRRANRFADRTDPGGDGPRPRAQAATAASR